MLHIGEEKQPEYPEERLWGGSVSCKHPKLPTVTPGAQGPQCRPLKLRGVGVLDVKREQTHPTGVAQPDAGCEPGWHGRLLAGNGKWA